MRASLLTITGKGATSCARRQLCAPRSTFKPTRGTGDSGTHTSSLVEQWQLFSGQTALFTLERRWKDDVRFEALGDIDELSSALGCCRAGCVAKSLLETANHLTRVQCSLQDIASEVATPDLNAPDQSKTVQRKVGARSNESS